MVVAAAAAGGGGMIPARIAAGVVAGAGWHALVQLAGRADGAGLATTLALLAVLGWALLRAGHGVSSTGLTVTLLALGVAAVSGITLLEIIVLVAALGWCALGAWRWPPMLLALLGVPMLPTLDVLVAGPLRRISAVLTTWLLRGNGIDVSLEGVALQWQGKQLLFDGPCSGVRMLWALLVLACAAGVIQRMPPARFALLLAATVIVAVVGNALRAASLFYLEAGFVTAIGGPVAHEAIGLAAFAIVAGGAVALLARGRVVAWR
ncbi:exosortase/archaeosortase family protein [Sphingomonas sp. Leaf25]|uniref:exosortase/archaeosortase family protein n=1 Tax=Sphingomonas sp. Leaf25 TaxID=1735692 RepID=UPI0009EB2C66|nr:exosortase/archaeosortase family protein [Sphingomonas sp. Leaf25]